MKLSDDERAELRATARGLLARESSSARVRAAVAGPDGFDRALWDSMVGLGWTTIHVPAERGGAGCGYADLAIILHELGRGVTPSPFLASAVLATGALLLADADADADADGAAGALLASLISGDALGSVACASADGSYDLTRCTTTWSSDGTAVRLSGAAGFVLDADVADLLIVAARDDAGRVGAFAVDASTPGVCVARAPTVDETRRLFTVAFDDVAVPTDRRLTAPGEPAAALFEHVLGLGAIAAACDATGVAEVALERSADYAKERTQFGKPIGSFQAVKHHCANMAIAVEASRAATGAAAEALDGDPEGWPAAAAITSSYVGPACANACALGLLVHGGVGFTWEHDSHVYLKRAKLDEVLFGTPAWHRRRLADAVFPVLAGSHGRS